jgi:chemotaxis protein methyltransferase CheR
MATFTKLNLIERWPPLPQFDIVFLRNVLIYFAPETKKAILEKSSQSHGTQSQFSSSGAAETTMGLDAAFERVQSDNSVFYRLKSSPDLSPMALAT